MEILDGWYKIRVMTMWSQYEHVLRHPVQLFKKRIITNSVDQIQIGIVGIHDPNVMKGLFCNEVRLDFYFDKVESKYSNFLEVLKSISTDKEKSSV